MITAENFSRHCAQLTDPNTTPDRRKELAGEVRDSIELVHSQEYSNFLANYLPAFKTILRTTTSPQHFDNSVHKTRAIILEIINRLPANEYLRQHVSLIFALAIEVLQNDNEDNAVTAIHIIFDLYKTFRSDLAAQVQPFLFFVRRLYESFGNTIKSLLSSSSPIILHSQSHSRFIPLSTRSFRVITECPLLVMCVFQLYPRYRDPNMTYLCPLMVSAIEYEVPTASLHSSLQNIYQEFIASQVKTVSFLAYLLKQSPDHIKTNHISIPRSVVKLLQSCPGNSISIRKDLLVATRLISSSAFKQGFFDQIDLLLDENVLVGRSSTDSLRPLAYSFLTELIHHVRYNLSIDQLNKVIYMFSTNIHDPKFTYVQQSSAVRLLMNLIEGISRITQQDNSKAQPARTLLIRILDTIVTKYITLAQQVPRLLKIVEDLRENPDPVTSGKRLSEIPVGDPLKEIIEFKQLLRTLTPSLKTVIWSAMNIRTSETSMGRPAPAAPGAPTAPYVDSKLEGSDGADGSYSGIGVNHHKGFVEKECELISQLLPAGRKCFRLYSRLEKANGGPGTGVADGETDESGIDFNKEDESKRGNKKEINKNRGKSDNQNEDEQGKISNVVCATDEEEREIFVQFAQVFTVLDVGCFQDVFGLRMKELFEHIVENPQAAIIPQHFLANPTMSKYFADILLNFLVDSMNILDVPSFSEYESTRNGRKAFALLKLFRIMFASVSLFPSNEPVLRLHVASIIRKSLKFAVKAEDPHAYLQLLKAFFKAITSGKHNSQFEVLYREFCPFIEPLFQGLLVLYHAPNNYVHRDTIVELCLVIPARPSTIFPFLELQMKPVIWSLHNPLESKETTVFGLRNLEFWIDMLQPSFLESLLDRVEPRIVSLLQDHLNSPDVAVAKYAAKILGKLGPRARQMKSLTSPFEFKKYAKSAQQMLLSWSDRQFLDMEMDDIVELCGNAILDKRLIDGNTPPWRYKAESWMFLYSLLTPMLGICDQNESDDRLAMGIPLGMKPSKTEKEPMRKQARTKFATQADENQVTALLTPLIAASHLSKLGETFQEMKSSNSTWTNPVDDIKGICRYFAALSIQELSAKQQDEKRTNSFEVDTTEVKRWRSLSPSLFPSAVLDVLSLENEEHMESGIKCLKYYLEAIVELSTGYKKEDDPYVEDITTKKSEASKSTAPTGSNPQQFRNTVSNTEVNNQNSMELDNNNNSTNNNHGSQPSNSNSTVSTKKPTRKQVAVLPNARGSNEQTRIMHPGERNIVVRHVIDLVEQFFHFCHRKDWNVRRAGVYGIEVLYNVIPELFMRSQYYPTVHFHSYRAMLYVSHGADETVSRKTINRVKKIVFRIIDFCFDPGDDQAAKSAVVGSKMLKDFTSRVGVELMSEWPCTREIARLSIERIASVLGLSVVDILRQLKDTLYRPLIQRTIRIHPLATQIGYVECVIFFLRQGKEKFTADLFKSPLKENLLNDCILVLENSTFDAQTEVEEGFRYKPHDNKFLTTKNTRLLLMLRRRIIELLCNVAVFSTELPDPANDRLFRNVISCFFRCLQSGDEEIVKSSKTGLKQAIAKHPKPKELLHTNLRPILGYLADFKKLSISYLQGLSRVLELFSHWFNLSLGDRLLEHLQRWTEPEKFAMGMGSQFKWTPGTESKIGAAILDLFHLLPPSAAKFLGRIVPMVIKLESVLPVAGPGVAHLGLKGPKAASTSPYRAPLLRFCNHHANITTTYFLQNINDDKMRQLLVVLLRCPESTALRKDFMDHPRRLTMHISFSTDHKVRTSFHIITIIDLLSEHDPAWIASDLVPKLTFYWEQLCRQPEIYSHGPSTLARIEEMKTLSNIFIKYCTHFPKEVNILFQLLPVFMTRTVCDFSFVKDFLKKSVSREGSFETKKMIITRFLAIFQEINIPQERKVHALQYLVIPMVSLHLKRKKELREKLFTSNTDDSSHKPNASQTENGSGFAPSQGTAQAGPNQIVAASNRSNQSSAPPVGASLTTQGALSGQGSIGNIGSDTSNSPGANVQDEVLDAALIQRIMKEILDQSDDVLRHYDEPLSAELLRLVTELIRYMPRDLGGYRKELIKFGWGHLKREESSAKHWAFVYVTTFFEAYTAPVRIILQVYVALLRAFKPDGRELVQQALDILTPALPKRLIHDPTEHRFPIWIRYTKKILLEEGQNTANLIHILQLIVRHQTLFYVARSWFVPIMAQTLNRIGLSNNANAESRRLCVDLIGVIINWERYRRTGSWTNYKEVGSRKRPRDSGAGLEHGDSNPGTGASKFGNEPDEQEPPSKTKRTENGQAVPTVTNQPNTKDSESFEPGNNIVDTIFSFLVQIPFRAIDKREAPILLRRSITLIEEASKMWAKFNVNMAFVSKTYELEKTTLAQQKNYAASLQQSMSAAGSDVKPPKPENKQELARLKRNANRPATLYTALGLMSVLAKHQKERFVAKNLETISNLVKPALNEADPQTALQCISLIKELLQIYPIQPKTSDTLETPSGVPAPRSTTDGLAVAGTLPQVNPALQPGQIAHKGAADLAQHVHHNVHESIDKNLCSEEPMRVYFGLVALQTITTFRPQEFNRHQEMVVRAFQSFKDRFAVPGNTSAPHAASSIGNGGSKGTEDHEIGGSNRSNGIGVGIERSLEDAYRNLHGLGGERRIDFEVDAIRLCLHLLGRNVATLDSQQRKTLFQLIFSLVDRCMQVPIPILLEMVDVASIWVFWVPREDQKAVGLTKDPLMPKDKLNILHKLASFERVSSDGADELMKAFFRLILRIFGGENVKEKRPELIHKLERVFLLGLKTSDLATREKFFKIFNDSMDRSLAGRMSFIICKQDWELFGECIWIRYACELLVASAITGRPLVSDVSCSRFPRLLFKSPTPESGQRAPWQVMQDPQLRNFIAICRSSQSNMVLDRIRIILQFDADIAHSIWLDMFPKIWNLLKENDRNVVERGLSQLLSREYHQLVMTSPQNNVKSMLECIIRCKPLPVIRSNLIQHLGSRWNAWHSALAYFELRSEEIQELLTMFSDPTGGTMTMFESESEEIKDAQVRTYRALQERDYVAGVWKLRAKSQLTMKALTYEQLGMDRDASETYNEAMLQDYTSRGTEPTHNGMASKEFMFWEDSWINCARNLCQWDILTEFSRSVMNYELMHECLWRVPEWGGMRELIVRNPIEDGPQLKLYEAFLYMQETKMEAAEKSVSDGIGKAIEKFRALPKSADLDSRMPLLVNLQQFVEMSDSANIFEELRALSGQHNQSISVDQKVDNVRLSLNTWRERLPSIHEPLRIWSDILTWRNHMHAVIVNVLENLKEVAALKAASSQGAGNTPGGRNQSSNANINANQAQAAATIVQSLPPQVLLMGINETAWNVHRFARASRKQGFPEVSLYAMNKLYPFGTMDLSEYFVKTKELSRAFLGRPKGLDRSIENGLHEINRCNMEHFSPRQKAQLFTLKSKLLTEIGRADEAADSLAIALNTSSDVGSTWLTWGKHCDRTQTSLANDNAFMKDNLPAEEKLTLNDAPFTNLKTELAWREATVNCYMQAIRFGSRSARPYLARVLRLLIVDVNARRNAEYVMDRISNRSEGKDSMKDTTKGRNVNESKSSPMQTGPSDNSDNQNMNEAERSIRDNIVWSVNTGVSKVISATRKDIPVWMWIPWLSQMVHMLARMEGIIVRPLLVSVAQQYPQALFYLVRSYVEERKLIDKPTKVLFKEAMKNGRPLIPPAKASFALQAAIVYKQIQLTKENYSRANQRFTNTRRGIEVIQKQLESLQDPNERAAVEAKLTKFKDENQNAHTLVDKFMQNMRLLQSRHQQLHASAAEGSSQTSTEKGDNSQGNNQGNSSDGGNSNGSRNSTGKEVGGKLDTGMIHMTPFEQADLIMTHIVKSNAGLAVDLERMTFEISSRLKPQREEHLLHVMSVLLRQCYRSPVRLGKKVEPNLSKALADVSRMCFRTGMESDPNEQKLPAVMIELKKAFESELAPQVAKDFPTDMEQFIRRIRRWQNIFQRRVNAFPEHMKLENVSKYMLDVKESDVEVFGQYECADNVEPSPETHVRIDQFESEIKVVHGPSHPCRGVKLLGTDGRIYEFALETSGALGVQAAEERTIQMYRMLNSWVFSKNPVAVQRRIKLATPILVPTGSRSRLISMESKDLTTVVEGLDKYLEENGKDSDEAVVTFRNLSCEILRKKLKDVNVNGDLINGSNNEKGKSEYNQNQIAARVEAFQQVCERHIPDNCLMDWLHLRMKNWDHRFVFNKRFAETLGASCISSHCLGVGARRPQMMVVRWSTGGIWNLNVRVLTSGNGVLESDEAVPFRLTRNIVRMLGPVGMAGPLTGSMVTTLRSIQKEADLIKMIAELVLRDELTGWVNNEMRRANSAVAAATGSGGTAGGNNASVAGKLALDRRETSKRLSREEYRLLEDRMRASGKAMIDRMFGKERDEHALRRNNATINSLSMLGMMPTETNRDQGADNQNSNGRGSNNSKKDGKAEVSTDVDTLMSEADVGEIVNKWIDKARDVNNLALMEVSWQPWY